MQMPKVTDDDKQRFRDAVAALTESGAASVKPMFGQLGAFVNGNMFACLFGPDIGVKLSDPDAAELRAAGGGPLWPAGRPMGGYVTVPSGADATEWAARAHAHVATMPPKAAKKR